MRQGGPAGHLTLTQSGWGNPGYRNAEGEQFGQASLDVSVHAMGTDYLSRTPVYHSPPNVGRKRASPTMLIDSPARSSHSQRMAQMFQHAGNTIQKENRLPTFSSSGKLSAMPRRPRVLKRNVALPVDYATSREYSNACLPNQTPSGSFSEEVLSVFKGDPRYPSPLRQKATPMKCSRFAWHDGPPEYSGYWSNSAAIKQPSTDTSLSIVQHWLQSIHVTEASVTSTTPSQPHHASPKKRTYSHFATAPSSTELVNPPQAIYVKAGYLADTDSTTDNEESDKENVDPYHRSSNHTKKEQPASPSPPIQRRNGLDLSTSPERREVLAALDLGSSHLNHTNPLGQLLTPRPLLSSCIRPRSRLELGALAQPPKKPGPRFKELMSPRGPKRAPVGEPDEDIWYPDLPSSVGDTEDHHTQTTNTATHPSYSPQYTRCPDTSGLTATAGFTADDDSFAQFPAYSRPRSDTAHSSKTESNNGEIVVERSMVPVSHDLPDETTDVKPLTPEVERYRKGDAQMPKRKRSVSYWDRDILTSVV